MKELWEKNEKIPVAQVRVMAQELFIFDIKFNNAYTSNWAHIYISCLVSFHFQRQNEDNVNGLKQELDTYKGKRVVAAYILNLTKYWYTLSSK